MKLIAATVSALVLVAAAAAEEDSCSKYAAWGADALAGCRGCQKWYPDDVDKCMGCGKVCWERVCTGKNHQECIKDPKFLACDKKCLARAEPDHHFSPNATCEKLSKRGEDVVKACYACAKGFPTPAGFQHCLGCGRKCYGQACEGKGLSVAECVKSPDWKACDTNCLKETDIERVHDKASKGPHKSEDCYFDTECHKLVDWEKIGNIKNGFFMRLKMMKRLGAKRGNNNAMQMMRKVHRMFVSAGMPDDRVGYILKKWVMSVYPEALATTADDSDAEMSDAEQIVTV